LVATFTVLFGAIRLISAADAVEGVTSAITAIAAARVTFFIVPFSRQETFLALCSLDDGEKAFVTKTF
jgi:hypothetical protein